MIQQQLQESLFTTSTKEVLIQTNVPLAVYSQWFNEGFLSIDLAKHKEINETQRLECLFISHLFSSNLQLEIIRYVLGKLTIPYSYNPNKIYFDVFKNEWEYLPIIIDDKDIVVEYIENLTEQDREEIKDLISSLNEKLS